MSNAKESTSDSDQSSHSYSIIKPLGKGASGNVVLALLNHKKMAIKQITCRNEQDLNIAMKVCLEQFEFKIVQNNN